MIAVDPIVSYPNYSSFNSIKTCKGSITIYSPNSGYRLPTQRHIKFYDKNKYILHEPLYWNFNIDDFFKYFTISDIGASSSLVTGLYPVPYIIDKQTTLKIGTKEEVKVIQAKKTFTPNKKVFVNIFSNTNIDRLRTNTYPEYFIYDICTKIPEFYKKLSLLDNNKFIIVPNSEKNYSPNINSPCDNPDTYFDINCNSYIFNCYFKDDDFIAELKNRFDHEIINFKDVETYTKYKYKDMFQLDLPLLIEVRDVIINHFGKINIKPENINIFVSHNNTYLNFVYLTIYILNPETINYVSFLDFNTFLDLNVLIKLHNLKTTEEIKLCYTININEKHLRLLDPKTYVIWKFGENKMSNIEYKGTNDFKELHEEYHKEPKQNFQIVYCKYYKNELSSYCDKSMLLKLNDQLYELSIKNITFDKLKSDKIYKHSFEENLSSLNSNKFVLSNNMYSYSRYYVSLPSYFAVLCKKTALIDSRGLINLLTIKRSIGNIDLLVIISIILYRYHSYTNQILFSDLLQQIPFIYINLYDLYQNIYISTNNYIGYSRTEPFVTITNEMANFYRSGTHEFNALNYNNGYKLLWHAPSEYKQYFKEPGFINTFKSVLEDIIEITKTDFIIKNDTPNSEIQSKLSNIYNIINSNDPIKTKLKNAVNFELIYPYILQEKNYKKIFREITDTEKNELYQIVNTGNYSDAILTLNVSNRFRIFHIHLISNYSIYKEYIGHYSMLPTRKISIINCFNNNIKYD